MLAGLFGTVLLLGLVLFDWIQFTSLTRAAARYGCRIAWLEDRLPRRPAAVLSRFDAHGVLRLPHGIARCFGGGEREARDILLRPQYRLFSQRFRTAWPLKGWVRLVADEQDTRLILSKMLPWSSVLLTLAWFLIVGIGTIAFLVSFIVTGGWGSAGGMLMGLGVVGLGLLVLVFGLVIVSLAYRLEDHRLCQAYQELRDALAEDLGKKS